MEKLHFLCSVSVKTKLLGGLYNDKLDLVIFLKRLQDLVSFIIEVWYFYPYCLKVIVSSVFTFRPLSLLLILASAILLGKPFHAIRSFIFVSSASNLFLSQILTAWCTGE